MTFDTFKKTILRAIVINRKTSRVKSAFLLSAMSQCLNDLIALVQYSDMSWHITQTNWKE